MKTREEKLAELDAASVALAEARADTDREVNLRVAIKLAEHVRAVGKLPGDAPQCLGALVALLEEIERREEMLLSEKALALCHAIEAAGASELLKACSVQANQLLLGLQRHEDTRPLTTEENDLIGAAWEKHSANPAYNALARDNVRDLFRELGKEGAITRAPVGRDPEAEKNAPKHLHRALAAVELAALRKENEALRRAYAREVAKTEA